MSDQPDLPALGDALRQRRRAAVKRVAETRTITLDEVHELAALQAAIGAVEDVAMEAAGEVADGRPAST